MKNAYSFTSRLSIVSISFLSLLNHCFVRSALPSLFPYRRHSHSPFSSHLPSLSPLPHPHSSPLMFLPSSPFGPPSLSLIPPVPFHSLAHHSSLSYPRCLSFLCLPLIRFLCPFLNPSLSPCYPTSPPPLPSVPIRPSACLSVRLWFICLFYFFIYLSKLI